MRMANDADASVEPQMFASKDIENHGENEKIQNSSVSQISNITEANLANQRITILEESS